VEANKRDSYPLLRMNRNKKKLSVQRKIHKANDWIGVNCYAFIRWMYYLTNYLGYDTRTTKKDRDDPRFSQ
jgi:hypothetical protein